MSMHDGFKGHCYSFIILHIPLVETFRKFTVFCQDMGDGAAFIVSHFPIRKIIRQGAGSRSRMGNGPSAGRGKVPLGKGKGQVVILGGNMGDGIALIIAQPPVSKICTVALCFGVCPLPNPLPEL